jgi:hypothetical protein
MEQKEQITAVEKPVESNPVVETTNVEEKPKEKLSKIEKKKLRVINKLIEGEINGTQAAKKLKLSTRQIRNLKRQVLNEGVDGVIYKNKNYKPYNTYDTEVSTFITKLYRKEYRGTNFSEFARIVQDEYGVTASRSTIYNFLRRGRIRSPQRKKKKRKIVIAEATTTVTSTNKSTTKK